LPLSELSFPRSEEKIGVPAMWQNRIRGVVIPQPRTGALQWWSAENGGWSPAFNRRNPLSRRTLIQGIGGRGQAHGTPVAMASNRHSMASVDPMRSVGFCYTADSM